MNDEAELLTEDRRSHWNEPEAPKAEHHAAVLHRGGGPVINEDFDFWFYTTDRQVMLKIEDENRLIMADSKGKLELLLEARYPTLPGCTIIDPYNGPLHKRVNRRGAEDEYRYNRRVRDGYSQYTKYSGWVVLNTPRLRAKDLDRDDLRDKLVQHKVLLLNPEDFEGLGGKERLMATGISPVPGCFGNMKVRWNPKAVKLRDWRKTVKEVQALHLTQFD